MGRSSQYVLCLMHIESLVSKDVNRLLKDWSLITRTVCVWGGGGWRGGGGMCGWVGVWVGGGGGGGCGGGGGGVCMATTWEGLTSSLSQRAGGQAQGEGHNKLPTFKEGHKMFSRARGAAQVTDPRFSHFVAPPPPTPIIDDRFLIGAE